MTERDLLLVEVGRCVIAEQKARGARFAEEVTLESAAALDDAFVKVYADLRRAIARVDEFDKRNP